MTGVSGILANFPTSIPDFGLYSAIHIGLYSFPIQRYKRENMRFLGLIRE
jgi:hypothetical protein